jgi:hypothetical protein
MAWTLTPKIWARSVRDVVTFLLVSIT